MNAHFAILGMFSLSSFIFWGSSVTFRGRRNHLIPKFTASNRWSLCVRPEIYIHTGEDVTSSLWATRDIIRNSVRTCRLLARLLFFLGLLCLHLFPIVLLWKPMMLLGVVISGRPWATFWCQLWPTLAGRRALPNQTPLCKLLPDPANPPATP